MLVGAAGGTATKWSKAIGVVEKLPPWANVRPNWRITPKGSGADISTIEQAARILREAHPYVAE